VEAGEVTVDRVLDVQPTGRRDHVVNVERDAFAEAQSGLSG
jgi:hypothetical protein